jgi:hypothetical protein
MCVTLCLWLSITLYLEISFGWPADRSAAAHRAIGWAINAILIRTFVRGMKRYTALRAIHG